MTQFYGVRDVPVNSCMLMPTQREALSFPRGDVVLGFCRRCGFISNLAFDPGAPEYSPRYEDQQCYSSRFNVFTESLARRLIDRYDLRGKVILEIGCGKGDFLATMCQLGGNRGIGIDPACRSDRLDSRAAEKIMFVQDFYAEHHGHYRGDLVCCRHTLEHIPNVAEFLSIVRRSLQGAPETPVFFEVPDAHRVLHEIAFWDIYYEHCSYFTLGSLARLFRACDFEILDLGTEFDNQYLLIEARTARTTATMRLAEENDPEETAQSVSHFARGHRESLDSWRTALRAARDAQKRIVLWGSGSKAVAFLTTLAVQDEVEFVVDINPHRQGKYLPGSGHMIVAPESLRNHMPDLVIVMNPAYCEEVRTHCADMGVAAKIVAVHSACSGELLDRDPARHDSCG
jgi:SAM-dependent methyltransferase